jgi:two-component system, NtrC family, response regulator HydG
MKVVLMTKISNERVLVVDDSSDTLEVLRRNLSSAGYQVFTAPSVAEAIRILESTTIELVLTDLKMPKVSGLDLIRHVRENHKATEIVMMTGYASIEGAVEAVKTGAEDYLSKPFTNSELFAAVEKALEKRRMKQAGADSELPPERRPFGLIGNSPELRKVFDSISKAATTQATVLITGESGTGKELVARAIHYGSARASAPFIPINCGAIPEGLLESELFGHVKGSFTGATESRPGFFQTAEGGTVFLDEISETSPSMQVKLLRVLQEKEISLVGDARPKKVDVRIVIATNKDLYALVQKKAFREDLFFRISVITIMLPPLRERGDDILLLANHFLTKFANESARRRPHLTDAALAILKNYDWPGNIRELENLAHRLVLMNDGDTIDTFDMPANMRFSAMKTSGLDRPLIQVEAEYIKNVLASVNGNKTRAAEILGIDRKTLREKLKAADNKPNTEF